MPEYRCTLMVDQKVVAMAVPLEEALLFLKAIAEEFYAERDMQLTMIREVSEDA